MIGKDIFELEFYKDKILPTGTQGDANYINPSAYGCDTAPGALKGVNCSADYLYQ